MALTNARVVSRPTEEPSEPSTVVIRAGRIARIGPAIRPPPDDAILDLSGGWVTAGFWNTHVHFTEHGWARSADAPASVMQAGLAAMLTSRGFTSVVDLGSDPRSTLALRARVDSGEIAGPRIYTSGTPLYPEAGVPYYLKSALPPEIVAILPQPGTSNQAESAVDLSLSGGSDLIKLFTGSWVSRGQVRPMKEVVATAAVAAAHRESRLVFAHPSDFEGTRVAAASGVDVLAHAPDATAGIDDSLLIALVRNGTAMSPTLKMFATTVSSDPGYLGPIYGLVRRFRELGGTLLFGTDVGYMTDYTTEGEFEGLTASGLSPGDILAMLTTNPVARLGLDASEGIVAEGSPADLALLAGDPTHSVEALSRVTHTIRQGRLIWSSEP